jgi:dGTP triphosphohydrolase
MTGKPLGFDPNNGRIRIFEVQIVRLADGIASAIHDFEDALISHTFSLESVVKNEHGKWPLVELCVDAVQRHYRNEPKIGSGWTDIVGEFNFRDRRQTELLTARLRSEFIYQLTNDAIDHTLRGLKAWESKVLKADDFRALPMEVLQDRGIDAYNEFVASQEPFPDLVGLERLKSEFKAHKQRISDLVVNSDRISRMDGKAGYIIKNILDLYCEKPKQVPDGLLDLYCQESGDNPQTIRLKSEKQVARIGKTKPFIRAAVDYVAGMTDRHALAEYDKLYSAYPRTDL